MTKGRFFCHLNAVYSYNMEERAAAKVKDGTIDAAMAEAAGISIE